MIIIEITLALILILSLGIGKQVEHLVLFQWHHGWLGIAIFILGVLLHQNWMQVIGLLITYDDSSQHAVQRLLGITYYRSPMHVLFYTYIHV